MIPEQITAFASTGESETLEFKATNGTSREAAITACDMFNQRAGQILFGMVPSEGAVLSTIDRKVDLHRRKRTVLNDLFKTLLHKLMTGDIRIVISTSPRG